MYNIQDITNTIICGEALESLKKIPDNSIHCVVTSPPYYAQRDYLTGKWIGGDDSCNHYRDNKGNGNNITGHAELEGMVGDGIYKSVCKKCGAIREDKQIGLEETPEEYVAKITSVFAEVKRVLREDGTLWLNLGDSYFGGGWKGCGLNPNSGELQKSYEGSQCGENIPRDKKHPILKPKDLIGIPWRCAFALQNDGWWLRQDIVWSKTSPMPESVKDRCTKSHEYIFLMSKSKNYFYDYKAIMEDSVDSESYKGRRKRNMTSIYSSGSMVQNPNTMHSGSDSYIGKKYEKKNKRDVWVCNSANVKEEHFACFNEELILPCILAGCPEGGIVLDPFMGSGTTAIVAKKNSRNYIGIELNPNYAEMSRRRIKENTWSLLI